MIDTLPTRLPPGLNEPAPDFRADTTFGPVALEDYAGRWLVLFSHPADFTPVCTTEFVAFARAWPRFQELGCDLLGLSVDSTYAHIAWTRGIRERFGVTVPFPVAEDVSMRIARAYGMIQPGASDTAAVRATFVIDPDGMVRAMVYYPMTTGRSVGEILRLVAALQVSAEHGVTTPEGWSPGQPALLPPPTTAAEADERTAGGDGDPSAWYLSSRSIPATRVPREPS